MITSNRILAGALAVLCSVINASAQTFLGADNFNDNILTIQGTSNQAAGQWRFSNPNASGTGNAWTETNGRMEFTTSATAGFNRGFLGWVSPSVSFNSAPSGTNLGIGGTGLATGNPYTSSWTAQVQVSNNPDFLSPTAGFSNTGFEIYSTASPGNVSNAYYGIGLNTTPTAKWIVVEWGKWNVNTASFDIVRNFIPTSVSTDVLLRMSYNGDTHDLVFDYSNDDGVNFLTGETYNLTGAQAGNEAPFNNGLGLEFYASTVDIGNAITSGQMRFDNLSVSAVPEPSTYAALAGAGVLGFACWRRRRRAI
jgi:hypothetical protein